MAFARPLLRALLGRVQDLASRRIGRRPARLIRVLILAVWRAPSILLSSLDWLIARPVALLAGVRAIDLVGPRFSRVVRYAILALWVGGAALAAIRFSGNPALIALAAGLLTSLGIVRRWMWIERDRKAFLVERGRGAHLRVGFQENLRNEAIAALAGFFALVLMALHELDAAHDAFDLAGAAAGGGEITLRSWLSFFAAEVVKPALFADWSDAWRAAPGSPIRPSSGPGAMLVFLLRAAIDFILLILLVQSVDMAVRLRRQKAQFRAGELSALDPLSERPVFRTLALHNPHTRLRRLSDAVSNFPTPASSYDESRLAEIVAGEEPALRALVSTEGEGTAPRTFPAAPAERDERARGAAMLALACRYPASPRLARLLAAISSQTKAAETHRIRALALLAESNSEAAEQPLLQAALDDEVEPSFRVEAVRDLGWLRRRGAAGGLSRLLAEANADPMLRIHAGLAIVKAGQHTEQTIDALKRLLAISQMRTDNGAILSSAYALALASMSVGGSAEAVQGEGLALRAMKTAAGDLDKMISIPAVAFLMGAPENETGAESNERPQRQVSLAAFELGAFAVTFEEYDSFCEATGMEQAAAVRWGRGRRPVINASFEDAESYCEWLSRWTGERFRLPSEAEWEDACRAGTTTPFSFGETISTEEANYDGSVAYGNGPTGACRQRAIQVGSFRANAFGLFDMHGNVWEWCADAWRETYNGAPIDGAACIAGESERVLRGGAWNSPPVRLRSAARSKRDLAQRTNDIGFRVARSAPPG
jgi:formylglycine-generating enzyme required for sulfatase activity